MNAQQRARVLMRKPSRADIPRSGPGAAAGVVQAFTQNIRTKTTLCSDETVEQRDEDP